MKTTKKTVKLAYIVDLTNVSSPIDVAYEFVLAKVRAGIPLTMDDIQTVETGTLSNTLRIIDEALEEAKSYTHVIEDDALGKEILGLVNNYYTKKKPWYKRFWGWVKKPFTKKK